MCGLCVEPHKQNTIYTRKKEQFVLSEVVDIEAKAFIHGDRCATASREWSPHIRVKHDDFF